MIALLALLPVALAGGRYANAVADVTASSTIAAPPEQIFSYLLDFKNLQASIPCVGKWEMSQRTFGEGASAMVRYDVAAMHRKLPVSLSRADAPYRIDLEHLGNLGFTTVITLKDQSAGGPPNTLVTMLTPLNPPPWPFRPYYYIAVQVEWTQCYVDTIKNVAAALNAPAGPAAPAPAPTPAAQPRDPLYAEPIADPSLSSDVSPS